MSADGSGMRKTQRRSHADVTASKPPTTKQPPKPTNVNKRYSTTNVNQPPASVNQPPASVNQPPATVNQPPATVNQPPATVNQPGSGTQRTQRRSHTDVTASKTSTTKQPPNGKSILFRKLFDTKYIDISDSKEKIEDNSHNV